MHKDIYICSGEEIEEYEPSFTYHGFQYVLVEGITKRQAISDLLTFFVYSTDLKELTELHCSCDTVNKLQDMTKNSTRSNFYHFPTDCPQREKNGWTGDIAVSVEHILINYNAETNLRQWLDCVRKAQKENGAIPCVIPTAGWGYGWGTGPAWDCALTYVPYYIYKYCGDKEVLEENADAIFKYINFLRSKKVGEFIEFGLGDWCEAEAFTPSTAVFITDTLVSYDICKKAESIFDIIGKRDYLNFTKAFSDEIYSDFRRVMVTAKGLCRAETQTCYSLLIAFGILNEEESKNAVKRLVELIHRNNDKIHVGIIGARYLFHVLSKYGYDDLAYKMIVKSEYPSYGEWVKKGSTSLWESFFETEEGNFKTVTGQKMDSLNHHFFGDISHWFMNNIVGINILDGQTVKIKPCGIEDIENASGSYERNGKKICVKWQRKGKDIEIIINNSGFELKTDGLKKIAENTYKVR